MVLFFIVFWIIGMIAVVALDVKENGFPPFSTVDFKKEWWTVVISVLMSWLTILFKAWTCGDSI